MPPSVTASPTLRNRKIPALSWALLTLAACGAPAPENYAWSLEIDGELPNWIHPDGLPLVVNGATVGTYQRAGAVHFSLPAEVWVSDHLSVGLELPSTCGPMTMPLTVTRPANHEMEEEARQSPSGEGRISATAGAGPETTLLMVDNTGGPATTLTVGQTAIPLPANGTWTGTVTPGSCAEARSVKIGTEDLGNFADPGAGRAVLIDAVGGHCYRAAKVLYTRDPAVPAGGDPGIELLGPARTQSAPSAHFFLTPPVDSMQGDLAAVRTEIQHVKCP